MKKNTTLLLINLFSITITYSQAGMWTWMHGSNLQNQNANYGIQGVAAVGNIPAGTYEGSEWTDLNGNFWLYGGLVSGGVSSALWKFNPLTTMWTWVQGPITLNNSPVYGIKGVPAATNSPGMRGYGAFTWVDQLGDLWLFGAGVYSDLWKYNIATNMWTWVSGSNTTVFGVYGTQGIPSPTNFPSYKYEGNTCWVDNTGNLWLFGGYGTLGNLNDLWKYNIATNEWTWMRGSNTGNSVGNYGTIGVASPTNDPPAGSGNYTKWKDKNGDFWFFCNAFYNPQQGFVVSKNDLWKYSVLLNQWTCVRANGPSVISAPCIPNQTNLPPARCEARVCWVDSCGNFWFFGGADNQNS